MSNRILVIDDDTILLQSLNDMLINLGYEVDTASTALDGLRQAYETKPDLIILDVMLPEMDGWATCQRFREMSSVPIIMFSSLSKEEDIVRGLELGADDYLVKPVTMRELGARIKALLRRVYQDSPRQGQGEQNLLEYKDSKVDLRIDLDKHEVIRNQERVELSPTEFRLLTCLMKHQSKVLPHDFLLKQVWGSEYSGELDHLRLYISYLRRKIELDPRQPELIQNEWGVGYRFG